MSQPAHCISRPPADRSPERGRRRGGFTLMEIMVVVGIILLLMSLGVVGYRSLDRTAALRQTRVTLSNAQAMVATYEATNGIGRLDYQNTPIPNPGVNGKTHAQTKAAMKILRTIPKNKAAIEQLPVKTVIGGNDPVLLDGWGNAIVLVPSAGMTLPAAGGLPKADLRAPSNRPFWASPGADGDFNGRDDNVYSFEQ